MSDYAVIDIGSNSIRYMEQGSHKKRIFTTRLGAGIANSGMLSHEAMQKSMAVIGELAVFARQRGLTPYAYATSAVRDAINGGEFAKQIEQAFSVPVDILTGEREARYAYYGVYGNDPSGCIVDIGGASFQIVAHDFAKSFRAGCVRCRDIAMAATGVANCNDCPLMQRHAVDNYLRRIFEPGISIKSRATGVGGSITTLAALHAGLTQFDVETVQRVRLGIADIEGLITALSLMGEERRAHPLLAERHDTILYGAYIIAFIMRNTDMNNIAVSCNDGMEGYLSYIYERNK